MTTATAPANKPNPNFSSGLREAPRLFPRQSERRAARPFASREGRQGEILKRAIDLTREVLGVPADYRIGIVFSSDTGAVEMALLVVARRARRRHAGAGKLAKAG